MFKKIRFLNFPFTCICFILLFSSCAKHTLKTLPVPKGQIYVKDDVFVCAQSLSKQECKDYFGVNLINHGYRPIQILIKNKSTKAYILNTANISIQIEQTENVASNLHKHIGVEILKYFMITTLGSTLIFGIAGIPIGILFLGPLGGVVGDIHAKDVNARIDADVKDKTLGEDDTFRIKAYGGILNKIIFTTNANYNPRFKLTLVEEENKNKLEFNL